MKIKFDTAYATVKRIASLISVSTILLFCIVSGAKAECPSPIPQDYCDLFFPGSFATAFCLHSECFQMSYGDQIRVVAADEEGLFPKTFFIWGKGELDISNYDEFPCSLKSEGKKKTRLEIPGRHCGVDFIASDGTVYHEFFISNPDNLCLGLGWLECSD